MHIGPGQAIRARHADPLHGPLRDTIAHTIQTRARQLGTAVAVIAEHVFVRSRPALRLAMGPQAFPWLLNGLRLGLTWGGNPDIGGHLHAAPPAGVDRRPQGPKGRPAGPHFPIAEGTGRHDPNALDRRALHGTDGGSSADTAWLPPRREVSSEGDPEVSAAACRKRNGRRHHVSWSRPERVRQNLSCVIMPSKLSLHHCSVYSWFAHFLWWFARIGPEPRVDVYREV
jgi:hypothetical protein